MQSRYSLRGMQSMFEKLKDLFTQTTSHETRHEENEEQQVAMAAAMLLLEVAWADHDITQEELDSIRSSLSNLYSIDADQVTSIVDRARTTHEESAGMHPFTRALNEQLSYEERVRLLEHLWRLVSFKASNFHYEEHVVRKVSDLLYLRHSDFIKAKLKTNQ